MLAYARSSLWDFVLCVAASTALAYTLCSGFYATQPFQDVGGTAIVAAICAVVTLLLFAVSRTSKTALIGGPVLAVALAGAIVASYALSTTGAALDDEPGNYLYFSLVTILPTVVVYVLSRWKGTTLVLLVLAVFACALEEYLYWYGHFIAFAISVVAIAGLYAYRTYQRSLLASSSEHLAFGPVTAFGVLLACASIAAGIGVFAAVIAPIDPPNVVLKLAIEDVRAQEREVKGIATSDDDPAENQFSMNLGNEIIYSSDVNDELYNQLDDDRVGRGDVSVVQVRNSSVDLGSMAEEGQGEESALSLDWPDWWWLVALISLLALILGAILARKYIRHRRYKKLVSEGNEEAVESLYRFFLACFERLKIPQPGSMTLTEYVLAHSGTFDKFGSHADTPAFGDLTQVYSASVFGGDGVSDGQLELFKRYYRVFYGNVRRYVGSIRYLWTFFRV